MEKDFRSLRAHVIDMVFGGLPLEPTLSELASLLEDLRPDAIFGISLVDDAGELFETSIFPGLAPSFAAAGAGAPVAPPYVGTCCEAIWLGERITCTDIRADTKFSEVWRERCLEQGMAAIQSRPTLKRSQGFAASFVTGFRRPSALSAWDDDLLDVGGDLIALAISRCRRPERFSGALN